MRLYLGACALEQLNRHFMSINVINNKGQNIVYLSYCFLGNRMGDIL